MKGGLLITAAVAVMAATVLLVSGLSRSQVARSTDKVAVAGELRESMLSMEVALDQALAGMGRDRLSQVESARQELVAARDRALALSDDVPGQLELVQAMDRAQKEWQDDAYDEIGRVRLGRLGRGSTEDDRIQPFERFLDINERYLTAVDRSRDQALHRAEVQPVIVIGALSLAVLLIGGVLVRRDARERAAAVAADRRRSEDEERFHLSQRRLAEALQVAASQPEAHSLVKHHLERAVGGSQVHILNRNNSADRLEPSTPLPEGSPLQDALQASEPRSCIAVRLSREFESGPQSDEVLECEICGRLPGDTVCRPLLVGGEVIGAVLLESEDGVTDEDRRRMEESVTAAAPVLANLRNLAIAEVRAATDPLTGLPNRRSVDDSLKRMVAQAGRSVTPLAVLQLDLDHFKEINDRFGHDRGDAALAGFAALLRSQLRASDFAGRSGGEEFIVLLPDTDRAGALALAEKLRHAVAGLQIDGVDRNITTSIGLAVYPDDAGDEATLLRLADRALYTAKQGGRNRVETASPPQSSVVPAGPR